MITSFEGEKKGLALIGDSELGTVVEMALAKRGYRQHFDKKPLRAFDFALIDPFFVRYGFLPLLKRRAPGAPIIFAGWEEDLHSGTLEKREEFYDCIAVPGGESHLAEASILHWFDTPAGRYLFEPQRREFGNGLWVWIAQQTAGAHPLMASDGQ